MFAWLVWWIYSVQNTHLWNWWWNMPTWKLHCTRTMWMWGGMVSYQHYVFSPSCIKSIIFKIGRYGDLCDKCVTLPGCKNGYCEFPLQCICEEGWSGLFCHKRKSQLVFSVAMQARKLLIQIQFTFIAILSLQMKSNWCRCSIRFLFNSAAICAENCSHGHCTVPGECVCHPGWFGPNCDQCMESPDCVHGRCVDTPLQCQCYDGYQGTCCEEPICSEGCHPEHVRLGFTFKVTWFSQILIGNLHASWGMLV